SITSSWPACPTGAATGSSRRSRGSPGGTSSTRPSSSGVWWRRASPRGRRTASLGGASPRWTGCPSRPTRRWSSCSDGPRVRVSYQHENPRRVPRQASEVGRALGACPRGDSGGDHARHPPPDAVPGLRRARPGLSQVGCRRPRVRGLLDGSRRALPRPLPSGRRPGGAGADGPVHPPGRLPRARGAVGRTRQQARAERRAGALHHVRYRGHAPRHAHRTRVHGVVLIFDEVITGYRYSPGGAQAYFGVTPDLTALAKIVAGGLPGGALCGKHELMGMLAFRGDPDWDRSRRVAHAGTFNANPLCAAAAIATLELCADASLQARANKLGDELRRALADVMKRVGAPGTCYGEASIYHVSFEGKPGLAGPDRPRKGSLYHLLR